MGLLLLRIPRAKGERLNNRPHTCVMVTEKVTSRHAPFSKWDMAEGGPEGLNGVVSDRYLLVATNDSGGGQGRVLFGTDHCWGQHPTPTPQPLNRADPYEVLTSSIRLAPPEMAVSNGLLSWRGSGRFLVSGGCDSHAPLKDDGLEDTQTVREPVKAKFCGLICRSTQAGPLEWTDRHTYRQG